MAVMEIRTHTHQIAETFDDARHDVAAAVDGTGHDVEQAFDTVRHDIASFADWLPHEIEQGFDDARHDAAAAADGLVHDAATAFDDLRHDAATGVDDVVGFFERLPGEALAELKKLPGQMLDAGENVIKGLLHGIEGAAKEIPGVMGSVAKTVVSYFTDPLKIFSPSQVMAGHGENVVLGVAQGVTTATPQLIASVTAMGRDLEEAGVHAVEGLADGMRAMEAELRDVVTELGDLADQAIADRLEIQSPSQVMYRHGQNTVQGYIDGISSKLAAVRSVMSTVGAGAAGAVSAAAGGAVMTHNVNVNVTGEGAAAGSLLQSPQYQQALQAAVQEVTLRYAQMNPTNGLSPTWGRAG